MDTNAVSVLIEVNISNPMLREIMTENAAKVTQWIPIYFQRQPRKLCPACLILAHNESECGDKAEHVQTIASFIFKFGEDFGEVIDSRQYNPKYQQGEKILISPKKTRGKKRMEKKHFQIPQDGFHVSTIYTQSVGMPETSTGRRPKRVRESSAECIQASVHFPEDRNESQMLREYQDETVPGIYNSTELHMHPSFYRAIPMQGDWDNLLAHPGTHLAGQEDQVCFLKSYFDFVFLSLYLLFVYVHFYSSSLKTRCFHKMFIFFLCVINMRILAWNVQGLGSKHTRQHLRECIHQYNPDIIFLSETKQQNKNAYFLLHSMSYPNVWCHNDKIKNGGLAV